MDHARVSCPEAEAILRDGVRLAIHAGMNEAHARDLAWAVRKVARHHAA